MVEIAVMLWGPIEGGANSESGIYFELEKELKAVAQKFGLDCVIEEVME